jgi:hypothetical protein
MNLAFKASQELVRRSVNPFKDPGPFDTGGEDRRLLCWEED